MCRHPARAGSRAQLFRGAVMSGPVVFIGDDFTGASDSLATYARAGRSARLVLDPDRADLAEGVDVVGFPTALRALSPEEAEAEIDRLWPAISALAPRQLHLKVCSTFDSAPHVGSIGAVARTLIRRFRPDVTAVIGGQPSLGRYCAFGTLFARGPDGATHRIDRHPVMSNHPSTPMHEADLIRHLAAQGLTGVLSVHAPDLPDRRKVIARLGEAPVLFDAITQADIGLIGEALDRADGRQLLIGSSSVAEALSRVTVATRRPSVPHRPHAGRTLVFAGSRSSTTAAQIEATNSFTRVPVTPEGLRSGTVAAGAALALERGERVLVHLMPEADYGLRPANLAKASVGLVEAILRQVPVGNLGIAGGDTSSMICGALGFDALDYLSDLAPGVCLCFGRHRDGNRDGMRLMLKGGQMGDTALFERFAEGECSRDPAITL